MKQVSEKEKLRMRQEHGGIRASSLLLISSFAVILLILVAISALSPKLIGQAEAKGIHKRSFAGLGCLGVYDKAKFTRLDRVCEDCYQLYREPDIHTACR